jgi:hypothetical protein
MTLIPRILILLHFRSFASRKPYSMWEQEVGSLSPTPQTFSPSILLLTAEPFSRTDRSLRQLALAAGPGFRGAEGSVLTGREHDGL